MTLHFDNSTEAIRMPCIPQVTSGEEGYLVDSQLLKALFWQTESIFENPVHHGDELTEFVCIVVRVPLLFRCVPALLIGYAQFNTKRMLLGFFTDLISL